MIMELLLFCSVLVCIAATPVHAQTCEPPRCFVNGTSETICRNCPLGFGVAVVDREFMTCKSSPTPRNTMCEPCIQGVNFSDANDPTSKCKDCLSCHSTKEVQTKECTMDSDAVCVCKDGSFYYDPGLGSCVPCLECEEGMRETVPCTHSRNRECGVRSTAVPTTTTDPITQTPINNATSTDTGVSTDPGISTKEPTKGPANLTWLFSLFFLLVIPIGLLVYSQCKKTGDSSPNNNNWNPCCLINIDHSCIGKQNNTYDAPRTPQVFTMNGPASQYQSVPLTDQNGAPATRDEVNSPRSVGEALGLSATQVDHLIRNLDMPDELGRNAIMLAERYLVPPVGLGSNTKAAEVLDMWVQQGKTKEDLVKALREIGRDDIADVCVEDSAGS